MSIVRDTVAHTQIAPFLLTVSESTYVYVYAPVKIGAIAYESRDVPQVARHLSLLYDGFANCEFHCAAAWRALRLVVSSSPAPEFARSRRLRT